MEVSGSKRTPSRCREWERQRRNKFNEAITKLGELVKAVNRRNRPEDPVEDVPHPKIEIIEKAIICLTDCDQQKTKLEAQILALQVELDTGKSKTSSNDASTQVYFGVQKKNKDGKYVKLVMLKKKRKASKVKRKPAPPVTTASPLVFPHNLPKLLPRFIDKKGSENTIVVLPAAPFIFPQRPLLLPSVPPAIVLIDHNLQTLNKSSVPIVNRNGGDITRTTMVNIVPISAYSHPLSAKNKKNNIKLKNELTKKAVKKPKTNVKIAKECTKNIKSNTQQNIIDKSVKSSESVSKNNSGNEKEVVMTSIITDEIDKGLTKDISNEDEIVPNNQKADKNNETNSRPDETCNKNKENEVPNVVDKHKSSESAVTQLHTSVISTSTIPKNIDSVNISEENNKTRKILTTKETVPVNKDKEKLPAMLPLDSTLCDNVVDAGNARLELAEEFLATSPTAAFLMSFPLVSGNRADSPAEEHHHTSQTNTKDNSTHRRNELVSTSLPVPYYEKPNVIEIKNKSTTKQPGSCNTSNVVPNKQNEQLKCIPNAVSKQSNVTATVAKPFNTATLANTSIENPFLNLSLPSLITTNCTIADSAFGLDFDCNISKSMPNQPSNYVSSNNFFYKSDPFGTAKSAIYSTSSITSSHEFNGLGLYPCAMEKYTSKNKSDYSSVDDNLMKIGSSRLTYDIDLGWSHKGLDFVNCTTAPNTINKDTVLTSTSAPYTSSYNPFNPDFHVPLVSNVNKRDTTSNKPSSTSFAETISSFYSQPTHPNPWTEDVPFYCNNNMSKTMSSKQNAVQNYPVSNHVQSSSSVKINNNKHYEPKMPGPSVEAGMKSNNTVITQQIPEKYTKKSPSKMHINWMTSETRSVHSNNCNPVPIPHTDAKGAQKTAYNHSDNSNKKPEHNDGNYFPIAMHNFPAQAPQEEFQVWPSARPLGTTEISIDPPPINLPTLVGDLALGPHDKNKKIDVTNRVAPGDIQNCGNFLSVTQLMNRSSDNMASRYQVPNIDASKSMPSKQNLNHFFNESNRKNMSHLDNHMPQPCYVFNEPKLMNSYESMAQFAHSKAKSNNKTEKSVKAQKNNYSTEALLRGANCTQKIPDSNSAKFMMQNQKYPEYSNTQESAVAQVSHFPPILDYSDNSYASQQFSGTTLYNSTTNTLSNTFYSNFMPGSSNLMSSNYTSGPFTGDFIDYNQSAECNYTNHKYEELKMRNNASVFQSEKVPFNYKSSRREAATKHKLECSKKESSKKYQSKKAKITNEVEDWNDQSHLLWQNKTSSKKHSNLMSEELPFPNYVGNQMPSQYQPDFFNSHLMPTNVQGVGHNMDRSLASFPVTSRANFNLSSIFPEITMKVQ